MFIVMSAKQGTQPMYPANAEPSLDELLTDPVAQLLMQGDGLLPEQVRACLGAVQRAIRMSKSIESRLGAGREFSDARIPREAMPGYACLCAM